MVAIEVVRREVSGQLVPRPLPPLRPALAVEIAVIQHTHVAGKADMCFDFALFRRVLEFVQHHATRVEIVPSRSSPETWTPSKYISVTEMEPSEDREPPAAIVGYNGNEVEVLVETENWWAIGGPAPYADSYTYAIHTNRDVLGAVVAHLSRAPEAKTWKVTSAALDQR